MSKLNASGMLDKLNELVLEYNIPVLGVCVGMQMMAHSSEGRLRVLGGLMQRSKNSILMKRWRCKNATTAYELE